MPESYEHRQRKVKASAMVHMLDVARGQTDPPRSWAEVQARLATYTSDEWRLLSVAAGRADKAPSLLTRSEVISAVAALAAKAPEAAR